jgi:glutamine amidotransferase
MQLMTRHSAEGDCDGLGWVDATTESFDFADRHTPKLKVPHMGWNTTNPTTGVDLFDGFAAPPRFYYVHSFHVVCQDEEDIAARCQYGYEFAAAFRSGSLRGVQFHPEKSHRFGLRLLTNFARPDATDRA